MQPVRVGSLEFKCSKVGDKGPLLVLLHGYGAGPLEWRHLLPHFESKYRILVPNLTPLFSSSQPIGFSKQVEYVGSLLNQVNELRESFVLVGSSFGGTLSFGLRAHFRSLVDGHVLINPMPLDPLNSLKSSQLRMLFGLNMVPGALPLFLKSKMGREILLELGSSFGFGGEGRKGLEGLSDRKLNLVSKAVQRFAWISQSEDWEYWRSQLKDHLVPLLVLTGQDDPLFFEKDFRSYQHLVPLSEHSSIEGGAHLVVRTHAELVASQVDSFVRSLSQEPELSIETLRHAI